MKMDIEGSEYEVVRDLSRNGVLCVPHVHDIFMEWHGRFAELAGGKAPETSGCHMHIRYGQSACNAEGRPGPNVLDLDDESFLHDNGCGPGHGPGVVPPRFLRHTRWKNCTALRAS